MLTVIYILEALRMYAKDAHYNFKGIYYKSLHIWMDEIEEPLEELIDEIKEAMILRKGDPVPRMTEINAQAAKYVPAEIGDTNEIILSNVQALVAMANTEVNAHGWETHGDDDLMGRIDSHLQKQLGLLNLALRDVK